MVQRRRDDIARAGGMPADEFLGRLLLAYIKRTGRIHIHDIKLTMSRDNMKLGLDWLVRHHYIRRIPTQRRPANDDEEI